MSCIHNQFNGKCIYFDGYLDENTCFDSNGDCLCENDECPIDSCTYYEDNEEEG